MRVRVSVRACMCRGWGMVAVVRGGGGGGGEGPMVCGACWQRRLVFAMQGAQCRPLPGGGGWGR